MSAELSVVNLGRVPYSEGVALQDRVRAARQAGSIPDTLLLLEHDPVYTKGRRSDATDLPMGEDWYRMQGIEVAATTRGGRVTYHGPGQLVGYPIVDLNPDRRDVHRYVRDLEEVLIRTARDYGIAADRVEGLTGVWVGREKLAAIGVRIARWVTSHGFALNVNANLDYFSLIVPCGIADRGITSLSRLVGRPVELDETAERVAGHFANVFDFSSLAT